MSADDELMEEIRKAGDIAQEGKPQMLDCLAVATKLAEHFDHRSVEDIQAKLRKHFLVRGLVFADA